MPVAPLPAALMVRVFPRYNANKNLAGIFLCRGEHKAALKSLLKALKYDDTGQTLLISTFSTYGVVTLGYY